MSVKIRQTLDSPPCCIQIHRNGMLFLGLYDLVDDNPDHPVRNGYIYVYDQLLQPITKKSTGQSAILDLKLAPNDPDLLVTAQSRGEIGLWKWQPDQRELLHIGDYTLFDPTILITALDFCAYDPELIALTLTDGTVAIAKLSSSNGVELVSQWQVHTLEAWIPAFVPSINGLLLSGGDDQMLVAYDIRSPTQLWSSRRLHDAGVVSILPEPTTNTTNILWTGGYDDNLVASDMRNLNYIAPKVLARQNLGGGVWRLLPSPESRDDRILACCMYGGARILKPISELSTENSTEVADVINSITEGHESMVYGGAWTPEGVVTCSFYDKVVQTWDIGNTK